MTRISRRNNGSINRGKSGQTGNDRVLAEEPLFGQEMCLNKDRPASQRAESPEPKSGQQDLSADWRGGKRLRTVTNREGLTGLVQSLGNPLSLGAPTHRRLARLVSMQPACEGPVVVSRVAGTATIARIEQGTCLDQFERFAYLVRPTCSLFADARKRGYQTNCELEPPHAQIPSILPRNPSVGSAPIGSGWLLCSRGSSCYCARQYRAGPHGRHAASASCGLRLGRASLLESRHSNARPSGRHEATRPKARRSVTRTRHGGAVHGATRGRRAVSVLGNLVSRYLGPRPRCEMGACRAGFVGDVSRLDGRTERGDVYGRR